MKKKILRVLLSGLILFLSFAAFRFYSVNKEKQRRDAFYQNLQDTSSPTVTVLRDSILIGYQNEKKTIHIYVPPNYDLDTLSHYPVMYFMDGESSFNDLETMGPEWQIDEVINAAQSNGQQAAIVIGINQAENRDAEYTPWINEDNADAHGAAFADWVVDDLKLWVDVNYRTKTEAAATSIGGISRSGMMAYYMLMSHPDIFGNALIQSPAMWVDKDRLMAMTLTSEQLEGKKIFVSVGEDESGHMIRDAKDVYKKFQGLGLDQSQLRFESIPNEGHWHVTWRKSFAVAYPWIMGIDQ